VTATTLRCEAVDDEVTVLVYKDWSVTCTGQAKYGQGANPVKRKGRRLECRGPECPPVVDYRRRLQEQEP